MTARRFLVALATIICLGATGVAAHEPPKSGGDKDKDKGRHKEVTGEITAEVPIFIPIGSNGCTVVLFHPGEHHLSGDIEGVFTEDGYFLIDQCTGLGFYYVIAHFTGTVLGSDPGTATFNADGRIHDSKIIDLGHWTLENGKDGLKGVTAGGTFNFTMGVGGEYEGRAEFERRKGK